jgi:hypothetical protein
MRRQRGATFLSWVTTASIIVFTLITAVKLAPLYMEFHSVRSMVDEIAADPGAPQWSKQQLFSKVDNYLNINGLYTLTTDSFSLESVQGKRGVRELKVHYDARKHWLANIDFLVTFDYSVELGKAGNT